MPRVCASVNLAKSKGSAGFLTLFWLCDLARGMPQFVEAALECPVYGLTCVDPVCCKNVQVQLPNLAACTFTCVAESDCHDDATPPAINTTTQLTQPRYTHHDFLTWLPPWYPSCCDCSSMDGSPTEDV